MLKVVPTLVLVMLMGIATSVKHAGRFS